MITGTINDEVKEAADLEWHHYFLYYHYRYARTFSQIGRYLIGAN